MNAKVGANSARRMESVARRLVWFPDTSALVTLAVHQPLQQAVRAVLSAHHRVLVQVVVDELESLAAAGGPVAKWAAIALNQLDWLGEPVRRSAAARTSLGRGGAARPSSRGWQEMCFARGHSIGGCIRWHGLDPWRLVVRCAQRREPCREAPSRKRLPSGT